MTMNFTLPVAVVPALLTVTVAVVPFVAISSLSSIVSSPVLESMVIPAGWPVSSNVIAPPTEAALYKGLVTMLSALRVSFLVTSMFLVVTLVLAPFTPTSKVIVGHAVIPFPI